tara:strand:+ start:1564 stop:1695 length:132 start_codon:yes stop_codon:yes gene_type:complete
LAGLKRRGTPLLRNVEGDTVRKGEWGERKGGRGKEYIEHIVVE